MDPLFFIKKYIKPGSLAFDILVGHGTAVMEKAFEIASGLAHLSPDIVFIREAAMLHDIGIIFAHEPRIGCHGTMPYICHGYLGRELLEREGYPLHALVCERHVGIGLTVMDIETHNLPLPLRDMVPLSLEERIICYADKFFSKRTDRLRREKSVTEVRVELEKFGPEKNEAFNRMHALFSKKPSQGRVRQRAR
jgi:uncharacterized protein